MPHYTRREFTKFGLLALPTAGLLSLLPSLRGAQPAIKPAGKVNSLVRGVHLGINVPYSFGNNAMTGDETLAACVQLGLGFLELRAQPVEEFLGAPVIVALPRKTATSPGPTAEQKAANEQSVAALDKWRLSAPMAKVAEFRKKYADAGVFIEILKVDNLFHLSDGALDYAFALAKALGAKAISSEISTVDAELKRVGGFATKHRFPVAYHGHASTTPELWEKAFSFSEFNAANVDLGHFVAGNNTSPVPFIKTYHDRITHVHIKDRKLHEGPNVPLGEGDTPVAEVLRLIRDNRWPILAAIEFEYPIPKDSTRMAEIARCVTYCREALEA